MANRLEENYLFDVVADDLKLLLKELLPKLEDFPASLAGNDGEDSETSAQLAFEKGIPTPLQLVVDAIQKRVRGVLTVDAPEKYDALVDNAARTAYGRHCIGEGRWIIEDLGWTQSGVSCYSCDYIKEKGADVIAQECFERLVKDTEWLASIIGERRAMPVREIWRKKTYMPNYIEHAAGRHITQQLARLMDQYEGVNGRFVRVSKAGTSPEGLRAPVIDFDPTFHWRPNPAEQMRTS